MTLTELGFAGAFVESHENKIVTSKEERDANLLARLRSISQEGAYIHGVPLFLPKETYDTPASRYIFEYSGVPWPITDGLWGRKYEDGIPRDDLDRQLVFHWSQKSLGMGNLDGSFGIDWNPYFPPSPTSQLRIYGDNQLAQEARQYIDDNNQSEPKIINELLSVFEHQTNQGILERRPYSLLK